MQNFTEFDEMMKFRGWYIIPEKIPAELILKLRDELQQAVKYCQQLRIANGFKNDEASSTAHNLLGQGESFTQLLCDFPGLPYVRHILGEYTVLNSFAGTINPPDNFSYTHRVHRDIRFYAKAPIMMLNTFVLLDDFNLNNGGTFLMSGSHLLADKPSDAFFTQFADRVVAPAGSTLIFNSNIWHASGINKSTTNRCGVSLTFTGPEIKPQYDYIQFIEKIPVLNTPDLRQLLGVYSQVPHTLEQWYQPREKRLFKVTRDY